MATEGVTQGVRFIEALEAIGACFGSIRWVHAATKRWKRRRRPRDMYFRDLLDMLVAELDRYDRRCFTGGWSDIYGDRGRPSGVWFVWLADNTIGFSDTPADTTRGLVAPAEDRARLAYAHLIANVDAVARVLIDEHHDGFNADRLHAILNHDTGPWGTR